MAGPPSTISHGNVKTTAAGGSAAAKKARPNRTEVKSQLRILHGNKENGKGTSTTTTAHSRLRSTNARALQPKSRCV